jgi:hypothetical protein
MRCNKFLVVFAIAGVATAILGVTRTSAHAAVIAVDDFATGFLRQGSYTITPTDLPGFDPSGSDKLIVTTSGEKPGHFGGKGYVTSMTYDGVSLTEAVQYNNSIQVTSVFYLDDPGAVGDLVVNIDSGLNGVGVSLLAISGTASGVALTNSNTGQSTTLTTVLADTFVVASHANNGSGATAQSPLTPLLDAEVGSAGGGSGYAYIASPGLVTLSFTGSTTRPVTVAAAFEPDIIIPEPTTLLVWTLLAGLGIGCGWWRRKKG